MATLTEPNDLLFSEVAWPAPSSVRAIVTRRGVQLSTGPYGTGNLALHVGDEPSLVQRNRARLIQQTGVSNWYWLDQVHGTDLLSGDDAFPPQAEADGCITTMRNSACVVLTADCLPVLLCDRQGRQVAAVHAGWRGLAAGILARAVARFDCSAGDLLAYLGPAIGPKHFVVGDDVKMAFRLSCDVDNGFAPPAGLAQVDSCFVPLSGSPGKYLCDLYALARLFLGAVGVNAVYGGDDCTFANTQAYFSYRREGITGRMASAIWLRDKV